MDSDDIDSPTSAKQLLFTPLMISMLGVVSTALAVLLYNFVMTRYFGRQPISLFSHRPNRSSFPRTQEEEKGNGVEEKVLKSIPVRVYTAEEVGLFRVDQTECYICLGEFEEGDVVRLLPNCRHAFHVHCIDEWFVSHSNCPVCRAPIVASELSMSLDAEVVEINTFDEDVEIGSKRALHHSASVVLIREGKLSYLPRVLRRSLSLDCTAFSNKIAPDAPTDSSTFKAMVPRNKSRRKKSSNSLGRVPSMVIRSFSRNGSIQGAPVLPP